MRTYHANLTAEKAKGAVSNFLFLKIGSDRYTDFPIAKTYAAESYVPWSFTIQGVTVSDGGITNGISITMSNLPKPQRDQWPPPSPPLSSYILNDSWKDAEVKLYKVWFSSSGVQIANADELVFHGKVSGRPSLNEREIVLAVTPVRSGWATQLPRRKIDNPACPVIFKGSACAYNGTETTCDKTYTRCTALKNTANFRGFRFWATEVSVVWMNKKLIWKVEE